MKFREIIVKSINIEADNYINVNDEVKSFEPLDIYLVPKQNGSHDRYVTDEEGIVSKQDGGSLSTDNLNDVVVRGNSTTKNEIILASNKGRAAAIGFNETTYGYHFGDMNTAHTGSNNVGIGYNTLNNITSGASNTTVGNFTLSSLTEGSNNTTLGYAAGYQLTKASANVFLGHYSGFNLKTEISESDLATFSPAAAAYMKEQPGLSGYNGTTFNTSLNTYVGGAINGNTSGPTRAAMSTIIGASTLNNVMYRNFNNIVIGAGNYMKTANSIMYNSIIIGNSINLPNQIDALAIGLNRSRRINAQEAIIYGELPNNRLLINAPLTIPAQYMPNAQGDAAFTKNLVAKPDGTFGWEEKSNSEGIPLTGTQIGKPVSGKIEFSTTASIESGTAVMRVDNGYISFKSGSSNNITVNPNQVFIRQGTEKYINMSNELDKIIIGSTGSGVDGANYYGDSYEENSFVQKKYIDQKSSYSHSEETTGGQWIDGKPIYKKTVKFDTIPTNGEIDLTPHFHDVETIVSNQMFTEWYHMDVAFAGNQYRSKAFITLQPEMAKIEYVPNIDYDYSLINSFTLTLEYTKKTL
ncbi:hypothetical protein NZ698_10975 [Chryseobacterium sp. PBS4-4]|uniref:Peptidase S74 domain-containing protein n=1 Tax=Chryseobacterium edaphi TaxID=2976532 RepID=A0ABT2W683_9FLAO|nr:hypothetical protein [Chryseobacterium edaphi]MCU7617721.1 hypothetical protein [Chryseobacterium edaphi]